MCLAWITALAALTASAPVTPVHGGAAVRTARCTLPDIRALTPGDRLQRMDDFRTALPAGDRKRLDRALPRDSGDGVARCDGIDRSRASCEAAAYLPALRRTGLMPRFLAAACAGAPAAPSGRRSR